MEAFAFCKTPKWQKNPIVTAPQMMPASKTKEILYALDCVEQGIFLLIQMFC